jgi:hypothetical protein
MADFCREHTDFRGAAELVALIWRAALDHAQARDNAHWGMAERFHRRDDRRILKNREQAINRELGGSVLTTTLGIVDEHRLSLGHRVDNCIDRFSHAHHFLAAIGDRS